MLNLVLSGFAAGWTPGGSVDLYTSYPTDVGIRGVFEGPGRLRVIGSVGMLPDHYLDSINAVAVDQKWYDGPTSRLIDGALQRAVVVRAHLGWRPFPKAGFQFELGYSWMGLGGGLTAAEAIYAKNGYDLEDYLGDAFPVTAAADLHRLEASLGYEFVIRHHLMIRLDLGASYTFDSKATIENEFHVPWFLTDIVENLKDDGEDELEGIFEKYVHTPILAVGVGWKF